MQTIKLQIWDTAGQERFRSSSIASFRGAEVRTRFTYFLALVAAGRCCRHFIGNDWLLATVVALNPNLLTCPFNCTTRPSPAHDELTKKVNDVFGDHRSDNPCDCAGDHGGVRCFLPTFLRSCPIVAPKSARARVR
jgi:hypothetical protein